MTKGTDFFETTGVLKTPDLLLLEQDLLAAEGSLARFKCRALGRSMITNNNTDGLSLVLFFIEKRKARGGQGADILRELMEFACDTNNLSMIKHMLPFSPMKWNRTFFERGILLGNMCPVEIFGERMTRETFKSALGLAVLSKNPKKDVIHFLYGLVDYSDILALYAKCRSLPSASSFPGIDMFFERFQVDEDKKALQSVCLDEAKLKPLARKI